MRQPNTYTRYKLCVCTYEPTASRLRIRQINLFILRLRVNWTGRVSAALFLRPWLRRASLTSWKCNLSALDLSLHLYVPCLIYLYVHRVRIRLGQAQFTYLSAQFRVFLRSMWVARAGLSSCPLVRDYRVNSLDNGDGTNSIISKCICGPLFIRIAGSLDLLLCLQNNGSCALFRLCADSYECTIEIWKLPVRKYNEHLYLHKNFIFFQYDLVCITFILCCLV